MKTNALDYIIASVLSQINEHNILCSVIFILKKMSSAECNYKIYNKELLAIVYTFEKWYLELAGTPIKDPIKILINYKNLEYFISTK